MMPALSIKPLGVFSWVMKVLTAVTTVERELLSMIRGLTLASEKVSLILAIAVSALEEDRAPRYTFAPFNAKLKTVLYPIPVFPPVTMKTFPLRGGNDAGVNMVQESRRGN